MENNLSIKINYENTEMIKVLFVCLGNICRSPMAQMIFQNIVDKQGLSDKFEIDSAGTEGYDDSIKVGIHYGTRKILTEMNIPFVEHYSRKVRKNDYKYFDYILVMDESNLEDIQSIIGEDIENKIHLLLEYTNNSRNIKDPWYTQNFEETYQDILKGCQSFLNWLKKNNKI